MSASLTKNTKNLSAEIKQTLMIPNYDERFHIHIEKYSFVTSIALFSDAFRPAAST